MEWVKVNHGIGDNWVQQVTEKNFRVVFIRKNTVMDCKKIYQLKIMQVDISKYKKEIKELESEYGRLSLFVLAEKMRKSTILQATILAINYGEEILKVKEKDYKVLLRHAKKTYNIPM